MAGHDDSGVSEKKSSDISDLPTFNVENMQSNMKVIYYRFVLLNYLDSLCIKYENFKCQPRFCIIYNKDRLLLWKPNNNHELLLCTILC